jgi:hypothetical protein
MEKKVKKATSLGQCSQARRRPRRGRQRWEKAGGGQLLWPMRRREADNESTSQDGSNGSSVQGEGARRQRKATSPVVRSLPRPVVCCSCERTYSRRPLAWRWGRFAAQARSSLISRSSRARERASSPIGAPNGRHDTTRRRRRDTTRNTRRTHHDDDNARDTAPSAWHRSWLLFINRNVEALTEMLFSSSQKTGPRRTPSCTS